MPEPTATQPATPATLPDAPAAEAICPYCGVSIGAATRCPGCKGLLDPLSRQASTNSMGPWFIRDEDQPFRPGCSHETLRILVARGRITPGTIVRGPTTRQFWTHARRTRGLAHLLGVCHNCQATVSPSTSECGSCGASFAVPADRQQLGLGVMHAIPVPGAGAGPTAGPSSGPTGGQAPLPAGVTVVAPALTSVPASVSGPAPAHDEWSAPARVPQADLDWAQAVAPMDLTAGRSASGGSSGAWLKLAVLAAVLLAAGAGLLVLLKDVLLQRSEGPGATDPTPISAPIVPIDAVPGGNQPAPTPNSEPDAQAPATPTPPAPVPPAEGSLDADADFARASALSTSEVARDLDECLTLLQTLAGRHPTEAGRLGEMSGAVRARREALGIRGLP